MIDRKEYQRAYRQANKEKCLAATVAWQKANKEKMAEYQKRYREKNKEKRNSYHSEWRKANKDKLNTRNLARYHAQMSAVPGWADKKKIALIYRKARELSALLNVSLEVDHVVPLNGLGVCGLHCEANLQILDSAKNKEKNHRTWPDAP